MAGGRLLESAGSCKRVDDGGSREQFRRDRGQCAECADHGEDLAAPELPLLVTCADLGSLEAFLLEGVREGAGRNDVHALLCTPPGGGLQEAQTGLHLE